MWVDADHDGQTDAGELKHLVDVGVIEINLDFTKTTTMDNGNLLGMVSSYTGADGAEHAVADVWFAKQAPAAELPTLADLLAAPAADLLAGPSLPTAQGHTAAVNASMATQNLMAGKPAQDDDLLRAQQNIL